MVNSRGRGRSARVLQNVVSKITLMPSSRVNKLFVSKDADGTNLLVGVEILGRGGDNGVRCKITGGACEHFGQGQITLKQAGQKNLTVVESGAAGDLFVRVNHDLKDYDSFDEKLVCLSELKVEPPNYSKFRETSVPSDVVKVSKLRRARKFNFPNPSVVDDEWLREKDERQLQGVGEEFTLERKKEVFVAVVDAIIKKIKKDMEISRENAGFAKAARLLVGLCLFSPSTRTIAPLSFPSLTHIFLICICRSFSGSTNYTTSLCGLKLSTTCIMALAG